MTVKIRSDIRIAAAFESKQRSYAAKLAGITINNLRTWIKRFNTDGFDGWINKKQPGQKPKWNWAKTGTRPRILRDYRFESAYIFGAICPSLKKASAENAHAVIIMDRAPWHKAVTIPFNISIIYLPAYSPELNPTEQIWDFLRSNYLSNRVYETIDYVFNACCDAWNLLIAQPEVIASIGTRQYFIQD